MVSKKVKPQYLQEELEDFSKIQQQIEKATFDQKIKIQFHKGPSIERMNEIVQTWFNNFAK